MYCPKCGTDVEGDGIGLDQVCINCYRSRKWNERNKGGVASTVISWILLIAIFLGVGYFLLVSGILDELLCRGTYIFGVCLSF